MKPKDLTTFLEKMLAENLSEPVMIWGPPGVGKSSVVAEVAVNRDLPVTDLRISQLAPTDLRGLPVPDDENRIARWYPPEFLPRGGEGILFLDELNMAPPAVQGIAQQLVLDRRVGDYALPDGWRVWAAGNRKEDRAAVFDFPSALANRFLHLEVESDFDSFRDWALGEGMSEEILAFLAFRSELLHKIDSGAPAWPSPRSWEKADKLRKVGLSVAPAVGESTEAEFLAYLKVYQNLPDLESVLSGDGEKISFPEEMSTRYAVTYGLSLRAERPTAIRDAFRWLAQRASAEWCQLFLHVAWEKAEKTGSMGALSLILKEEPRMAKFLKRLRATKAA